MKAGRARSPGRLTRLVAALAGILGLGVGAAAAAAALSASAAAQDDGFRSVQSAPPEWLAFAGLVQTHFQERLSGQDEPARRVQAKLVEQKTVEQPLSSVVAQVWMTPGGGVSRLEFGGATDDLAVALRDLLMGSDVGAVPPPDLQQPLHLKLQLDQPQ